MLLRRAATGVGAKRVRRPLWLGLTIVGLAIGLYWIGVLGDALAYDVHAYYAIDLDRLYVNSAITGTDAYHYPPPFAQLLDPFGAVPWPIFLDGWRILSLAAAALLAGPLLPLAIFWSPVPSELNAGNLHILLGLAIVAGFRWPAAWAFVLLTKITPGVGLAWFAFRREWRALAISIGVTAAISLVSFVVAPSLWFEFAAAMLHHVANPGQVGAVIVPGGLGVRLAASLAILALGARFDVRSAVPVAAFVSLPETWWHSSSMLLAVIPLAWRDVRRWRASRGGRLSFRPADSPA